MKNKNQNGQGKSHSESKKYFENDEYLNCRKKGHRKKDFSILAKGKGKQGSTVNIAYDRYENSEIALIGSFATDHKDKWILNLDNSYHICPN